MVIGEGWGCLFDELKDKDGLGSDAELARSLGITRAYICSVRKGRKNVSLKLGQEIFARLGRKISGCDLENFTPLRFRKHAAIHQEIGQIVRARAKGRCELCGQNAPFLDNCGNPYLELHHLVPLVLGGANTEGNVVALCPNCHRKMDICPTESDEKKLLKVASSKRTSLPPWIRK
jgi:hypothetical protein